MKLTTKKPGMVLYLNHLNQCDSTRLEAQLMGITVSTAPLGTMSTGGETTSTTESEIIHGTIAPWTHRENNLDGNGKTNGITINGMTMLVQMPMMVTTTRMNTNIVGEEAEQ